MRDVNCTWRSKKQRSTRAKKQERATLEKHSCKHQFYTRGRTRIANHHPSYILRPLNLGSDQRGMHETRPRPCCKCYTVSLVNDCQKIAVSDRAVAAPIVFLFSLIVLWKSAFPFLREIARYSPSFLTGDYETALLGTPHGTLDHRIHGTKMVELRSRNSLFSPQVYRFIHRRLINLKRYSGNSALKNQLLFLYFHKIHAFENMSVQKDLFEFVKLAKL